MIEIKHRLTGTIVFCSETASSVRDAVFEAMKAGSNLSGSNLRGSDLRDSDLRGSNLRGSDLRDSDLRDSNLSGTICLSVTGLPSGHAILTPLPEGWRLTVGCWSGTVTHLRELIARDDGWPGATGDEILARRPILTALADMCDAWTATRQHILDEVMEKWGNKTQEEAK